MPLEQHPTDPDKLRYVAAEYNLPKPWVGLTKEAIAEFGTWYDNREEEVGWVSPAEIVAYIEAKLKEKNNG